VYVIVSVITYLVLLAKLSSTKSFNKLQAALFNLVLCIILIIYVCLTVFVVVQ